MWERLYRFIICIEVSFGKVPAWIFVYKLTGYSQLCGTWLITFQTGRKAARFWLGFFSQESNTFLTTTYDEACDSCLVVKIWENLSFGLKNSSKSCASSIYQAFSGESSVFLQAFLNYYWADSTQYLQGTTDRVGVISTRSNEPSHLDSTQDTTTRPKLNRTQPNRPSVRWSRWKWTHLTRRRQLNVWT